MHFGNVGPGKGDQRLVQRSATTNMLWKGMIPVAALAMLGACIAARAEAEPVSGSVTISDAPATISAYGGSQCESNTYSGQCPSGDCQCIVVSGNFCDGVLGEHKRENAACSLFITVDNGLMTGSPGCGPIFGTLTGFIFTETEAFLLGTYCPARHTFFGGWALDVGAEFDSGAGGISGRVGNDRLSLGLAGTLEEK
jgi:hypothetical protein